MTDAQAALAQVREALADPMLFDWARDWDRARAIRAFERSCTTANIAAILAHVETQAAEIERLTAALQHEADCVEAAKEEIERLTAALHAQPGPVSMDDVECAGKAHLADCEARNQKLHAACTALAALVQRDRVALYEAHHYPHSGEIDDEGREALAEYDAALALADQAMGVEGTERNDV